MIDMSFMFNYCENLVSLGIRYFDTSSVVNMSNMFAGCRRLNTLDLHGFNASKVTAMENLFYGCVNLTTTITISNPNVETRYGMFSNRVGANGKITLNYTSATPALVDQMIADQPTDAKVVKGTLVSG